ncbi:MmyB family transcriptional regulator [Micromonospora sp. NPDC005161]
MVRALAPRQRARTSRRQVPGLLRILDDTMPISVHDGRLDLLAYNAAAADLLGQLSASGRYRRNIVYQCVAVGRQAPAPPDRRVADLRHRGSPRSRTRSRDHALHTTRHVGHHDWAVMSERQVSGRPQAEGMSGTRVCRWRGPPGVGSATAGTSRAWL